MTFTLIVCTYMRPKALLTLLNSVVNQTLYPDEIIIVDGSVNDETRVMLEENYFKNLSYYLVEPKERGLTRQRNFGIEKVSKRSEIVCFLDDDIVLDADYFKNIIATYAVYPVALAVGGYITNEVRWEQNKKITSTGDYFCFDNWCRKEPSRFKVRRLFGLEPDAPPGWLPSFSHMRSIGFLPPTKKIYNVEMFMGGVSSYKMSVFKALSFSNYFEGYGLYEDADFCLRIAKHGPLFVNTAATCSHYHAEEGRPNMFKYGQMVIRNGWYIWRVKYPNPHVKSKFKWHSTALLLTVLIFLGCVLSRNKKAMLTEGIGRVYGWWQLLFNKPCIQ
ncbi:glycosyltransferase family 2 protein [Formosa haliotis]|uniref:glycosyltransferase family 2 protein n=1 Tax=Formosa haliotis TaxID=1555194 RepID=UPI000823FA38|nr:glycosyltransferase [Formosa haliotis]